MKTTTRVLSIIVVLALLVGCTPAPTLAPTAIPTATFPPPPTAAPTPEPEPTTTAKVEIPLEQLPATIAAATEFANAMTAAGTPMTAEHVLQPGLTLKEKTGRDGNKYQIALTLDGYPLMIKAEGVDWGELRPRLIEGINGAKVYIAGDYKNIVEMDKIQALPHF